MTRKLAYATRRQSGDGSLETLHEEETLCSDFTAQAGLSVRKSRRNRNRHKRSKSNAYVDQGWEIVEAEGWVVTPKAKSAFDDVKDYDWEVIPAQEIPLSSSKSNQPMRIPLVSSNEEQIPCVLEKDGRTAEFEGSLYSLPLDGQDEEIHRPTEVKDPSERDCWEHIEIKEWDPERITHISLAINRQLRAVRNTEEIKLNELIVWLENEKALRLGANFRL